MTLSGAFLDYGVRFIVYTIVAGVGIAIGIRLRKAKNKE